MTNRQSQSALERHLQTLISVAALALLSWNFMQVQELSVSVARMTEQIVTLRAQTEAAMIDRYRGSDAAKDFAVRDQRLAEQGYQIREMGGRMRKLENRMNAAGAPGDLQ